MVGARHPILDEERCEDEQRDEQENGEQRGVAQGGHVALDDLLALFAQEELATLIVGFDCRAQLAHCHLPVLPGVSILCRSKRYPRVGGGYSAVRIVSGVDGRESPVKRDLL